MTLEGIDLSKWQTTTPPLTGLSFLFARASIGTATDERYAQHIATAKAAGIVTGSYHFNWDTISVAAQVTTFIAASGDVDLYALDVEGANAFSDAQATEFIRLMHAAGLRCGLYHSASGFFNAGQDWDWIAKWSTTPPAAYDFWQYTSDGSLPGYSGRLDFDRFNGTLDELHALAGKDFPMIPVATTKTSKVALPVGVQLYDQAFAPLVKVSVAQTADGYFDTGTGFTAIEVVTGGKHQLAFVKTAAVKVTPVTAPPDAVSCKPYVDAAVATLRTAIKVEETAHAAKVGAL